ncbi:MAG: endolytic transglycosylase MltG [Paludibacter sp.]
MSAKTSEPLLLKKPLSWLIVVVLAVFIYFAYILFAPNIFPKQDKKAYLCIPDSSGFEDVVTLLQKESKVWNTASFKQVSALLRYTKIRPGRYELKSGMNNFQLVRILRSGRQTPVKLTFNNIRTKEQLAGRLSLQLMADSASILNLMNDTAFLATYQLNPNTSIALFIPDTYEVFWDMDAKELFERMKKEYNKFWTDERKAKALAIPLTPVEVSTLASIVEEETNGKAERPMVAGLYINRLKKNMPLQADPTLKFAVGDFSLKRILLEHVLKISPYNTYRNRGLPPGPIRVASPNGIDAVLNYEHHGYLYMCAKETLNGEHNFAATYAEHQANAAKYQKALDDRKIFK